MCNVRVEKRCAAATEGRLVRGAGAALGVNEIND